MNEWQALCLYSLDESQLWNGLFLRNLVVPTMFFTIVRRNIAFFHG